MPRRPGPHPHAPGRRTPSSNPRLPSPLGEKTWRKSPEKSPPAALCHAAAESKPRVRARNGTRPPLEGEIRIDIPAQVERERTLDSAARARPPPPPPRSRCSAFRKGGEVEEDVRRGGNRGGNIFFFFFWGWGGGEGGGWVAFERPGVRRGLMYFGSRAREDFQIKSERKTIQMPGLAPRRK